MLVVLVLVRVYLDIHLLPVLDVQDVQRRVASIDHLQGARVRRVIVPEERTIVDGEAISPEVKFPVRALWGSWGVAAGVGVGDGTRGSIVATEGRTSTAEMRVRSLVVAAWSGSVSAAVSLSITNISVTNLLSRPLEDVVDLVALVCCVGVLDGQT